MNTNYLVIESDNIKATINKYLHSNQMVIVKSDKITTIEKFPLSNILLVPSYLSEKFVNILTDMDGKEFGIRKDQINEVFKYTENIKLSDDLLNLIKLVRQF